jgi:hypothetical protein
MIGPLTLTRPLARHLASGLTAEALVMRASHNSRGSSVLLLRPLRIHGQQASNHSDVRRARPVGEAVDRRRSRGRHGLALEGVDGTHEEEGDRFRAFLQELL